MLRTGVSYGALSSSGRISRIRVANIVKALFAETATTLVRSRRLRYPNDQSIISPHQLSLPTTSVCLVMTSAPPVPEHGGHFTSRSLVRVE